MRMPLESYPLQALVSEPVKPVFPCVVMSNAVHAYISQSDKGELVIGAGTDQYVSYSQRGGLPLIEHTLAAICEIFPIFTPACGCCANGAASSTSRPTARAIIGKTPVPGLYVNCGWGTGGFKATPGAGAHLRLDRRQGRAAPDQRALHAGALHHRPADRRSRRRRRRALRRSAADAADPLPLLRHDAARAGVRATPARRTSPGPPIPPTLSDEEWARLPLHPQQPAGLHFERWRHIHGCGRFFNAARDTVSDRFLTTYKAGEPKPDPRPNSQEPSR